MKKQILAALCATQLMTQAYAGGDMEVVENEALEVESEESHFYVVVKGLASLGAEAEHGEAILEGDGGYGFGIDLGYRIANGFAIEYDFSYAKNTVKEHIAGHVEEEDFDATYYTSSLDLVYTFEATETVGLFAKVGYEYEWEEIDGLHIDSRDDGFIVGAGIEVSVSENYKLVAEYEHSTIDSPRGDSLYAGLMFSF